MQNTIKFYITEGNIFGQFSFDGFAQKMADAHPRTGRLGARPVQHVTDCKVALPTFQF